MGNASVGEAASSMRKPNAPHGALACAWQAFRRHGPGNALSRLWDARARAGTSLSGLWGLVVESLGGSCHDLETSLSRVWELVVMTLGLCCHGSGRSLSRAWEALVTARIDRCACRYFVVGGLGPRAHVQMVAPRAVAACAAWGCMLTIAPPMTTDTATKRRSPASSDTGLPVL